MHERSHAAAERGWRPREELAPPMKSCITLIMARRTFAPLQLAYQQPSDMVSCKVVPGNNPWWSSALAAPTRSCRGVQQSSAQTNQRPTRSVCATAASEQRVPPRRAPQQASATISVPSQAPGASFFTSTSAQAPEQPYAGQGEAGGAQQEGGLRWLFAAYDTALQANPMRTKALTSCVGFAVGDILAQGILGDGIDPLRFLRLSLYGLLLDGPVGHTWYRLLDERVHPEAPASDRAVLLKTAADQVFWAPAMTIVFFAFVKALELHPELILPTIQDKLCRTVAANYVVWPLAHYINFRFVPSGYRILYNNVVSVAWTCYLSWSCIGLARGTHGLHEAVSSPETWLAAVRCAQHAPQALHHAGGWALAAPLHALEDVGEALGMDRVLAAWGVQGFAGSTELSSHFLHFKLRAMQQVCQPKL